LARLSGLEAPPTIKLLKFRNRHTAVIFDLDGTLLDTLDDIADSLNRVLRGKGLAVHPVKAYRYFVGSGAEELVSRTLPPAQRAGTFLKECVEAFRREYGRNWNVKTRPYDGIPELLDALAGKDITMAVLSNKPHEFVEICVREYFPAWELFPVLGERDGFPVKPNPAGALEIARETGVPPGEFIFLGDSGTDMETAVQAGMFPLGALWGFRPEKELREHGAADTISRPSDLLHYFTGHTMANTH